MFCAVYFRPEFITQNPDVSAHLSLVDVTEGTEVKEEIVVGERHLCVGYAAVVTCRGQRSIWLCVCVCVSGEVIIRPFSPDQQHL